jgi:cellulose synthase/poly-beta-1,6-N-acetylglucosamine synthase-like glycosyltransferase
MMIMTWIAWTTAWTVAGGAGTLALLPFVAGLAVTTVAALAGARRRPRGALAAGGAGSPRFDDPPAGDPAGARQGGARGRAGEPSAPAARLAVLVPAHDEELLIARTVASLLAAEYPSARRTVVVIADNCTDATAARAREAGAVVWERRDPTRRGKGHALEWAIPRVLAGEATAEPVAAVVLVDADTLVDPGLLKVFAGELAAGRDWVQSLYLASNPDASWRTQLLTYALALFNGAWLLGQDVLGVGVALRGNGMCFSAAGLKRQPWAAFGLAEDLEFAWRLRLAGERVYFAPAAKVYGELVSGGGAAAVGQRQRWEHGRKALRRLFTGPLWRAPLPLWQRLYGLFDLYMPPLSKLAAFLVLLTFIPAPCPLRLVQVLALGVIAVYALTPFVLFALPLRYLWALRHLPVYVGWKLALAARKGPLTWVRTGRDGEKGN